MQNEKYATLEEYLKANSARDRSERATIEMLVGDFQRMDLYAKKGYQIHQDIPDSAWDAFHSLVNLGYTAQLAR